jgi:transcriptional regulator with XRE-family HTH domain
MNILGRNLKTIREEWGYSQIDFGKRFGVNKSTISMYESGTRTPKGALLMEIVKLTGFTLEKITDELLSPFDIPKRPIVKELPSSSVSEPTLTYEYDLRAELLLQKKEIEELKLRMEIIEKQIKKDQS